MSLQSLLGFDISGTSAYPRIGPDAAVERGVVAGDGKSVDQRLRELGRLLEVVVFKFVRFDLQACGGKGTGTGLCMILVLSGIMWGVPCVARDRQRIVFIVSGASNTVVQKYVSHSPTPPGRGLWGGERH